MTSAGSTNGAGCSKWQVQQATTSASRRLSDDVDLEAGQPAVYQDITGELSDGDAGQEPKSRQNSLDFCINRWNALQASAEEDEEKQAVPEKDVWTEKIEDMEEPPRARTRECRIGLSDYLPGFKGDADRDCEDIELGQYPNGVHRGAAPEPHPPSSTSAGSDADGTAGESLLEMLIRCFTQ